MSTLQEDLIQDFKEQKELIHEQLAIFDPLGTQMRKPAARRLVSTGALVLTEVFCYLMAAGFVAMAVFLHKLHPFYILAELQTKAEFNVLGSSNLHFLSLCVYVMVGLLALLFYIIGRNMRTIRLKNSILNFAGKHVNTLVGQHLKRKAVIETIEQRHRQELPVMPHTNISDYEGINLNDPGKQEHPKLNEVPNPGFGD